VQAGENGVFKKEDSPKDAVMNHSVNNESFVKVSPRDNRYLELGNGKPYIPVGLNVVPSPKPEEFEKVFAVMAENRLNYCRVWLNYSSFQIEKERTGVFDEAAVNNLELFLKLACERGIRIKLCLEYFRHIRKDRKEWSDNTIHHTSNGGLFEDIDGIEGTSMIDFMESQKGIDLFKQKLLWYKNRFGDNPAIFAWELWNEINNVGPMWLWASWTREMLDELNCLFPKNMTLQSLGSLDREEYLTMYAWLSTLPNNNICQVHRYLDLGAKWEVCQGPVDILAAEAVRELKAFGQRKPVILAESGAVEPQHSGPFNLYSEDVEGTILHDVIWAPFMAGAAGTGQIWHWDKYVRQNNIWWHFTRFAEAVEGIDPPAEGFEPLMIEHPKLRVYILRGQKTVLIWCRDKNNGWRTELQEKIKPEHLTGIRINLGSTILHWQKRPRPDLMPILPNDITWRGRIYNPWTNKWKESPINENIISLPPFYRSIVIRIDAKNIKNRALQTEKRKQL